MKQEDIEDTLPPLELEWTEEAKTAVKRVPFFVRKSAVRGIEEFARAQGIARIDASVVARARQEKESAAQEAAQPAHQAEKKPVVSSVERKEVRRQYVNFVFFKVDPAWRRLPAAERETGKRQFREVVEEFTAQREMIILPYCTVGIRHDADFMLWRISYELEAFQEMSSRLLATSLGQYLHTPFTYLAMTKRSIYVDKISPEHEADRTRVVPGKAKYLFVYPFVKTHEWYLLSKHTRQGMMDEHIHVGNKYPSVKLNTTYSFGLDDQDFVVAFETNKPEEFLDLVMELRETEARRYTARDVPIFTCIGRPLNETLDALGG